MKPFPALLLAFLIAGCGREEPAKDEPIRNVRAMKVGDINALTGRSFPGRAQAAREVDLAFRVSGPLVALPVIVGTEVKKGDLIASIDRRDFEVALQNAEGSLQRAQANVKRAQLDYDRMAGLQRDNPGAISETDVSRALEDVDVAKADVVSFKASVQAAQDALDDTNLRAPFDGTIVATFVENFQNVREKQMIARLLDTSRIEFVVGIPETLISMAPYVEEIFVRFDAFPDIPDIPATTKEIGTEASTTTRTFPVTVIMDQPEGVTILPGMAGRGRGTPRPPGQEEQIRIVIPVTAVFAPETDGPTFAWIINPESNAVSRREVKLAELINTGYVIDSGLEPDEIIATAGVNFLEENQVVTPIFE